MYIRLRPVGMLTDVHNWLQQLLIESIVFTKHKKKDTLWVSFFLALQWDSKIKSKLPVAAWSMPAGWHRNINFLRSRKCKRIPSQGDSLIQIDGFLS